MKTKIIIFVLQSVSLCYAAEYDPNDDPHVGCNCFNKDTYKRYIEWRQFEFAADDGWGSIVPKSKPKENKSLEGSSRPRSPDRTDKHTGLPIFSANDYYPAKTVAGRASDKKSVVETKQEPQQGSTVILGISGVSVFEVLKALRQKKK